MALPLRMAGSKRHWRTAFTAARSRSRSPLRSTTRTSTGLPWASTSATTTTVPPTPARSIAAGYFGSALPAIGRASRLMGAGRVAAARSARVRSLAAAARSLAGGFASSITGAGRAATGASVARRDCVHQISAAAVTAKASSISSTGEVERRGSTVVSCTVSAVRYSLFVGIDM